MTFEIELTEEQEKELEGIDFEILGSREFVIPAQIKIPHWDNSISNAVVKARLMTGKDAVRITKFVNDLCREIKERESNGKQKDFEVE